MRVREVFTVLIGFLVSSAAFALSTGTGFVITDDGYIVTNFHVVDGGTNFAVRTISGDVLAARVVRVDRANDLALLKADSTKLQPIAVTTSGDVRKAERVITIGFPQVSLQGLESKVTDGIISSLSGIQGEPNTFQISVPVQPGNSGGPLILENGLVIGVIVSKLSPLATMKNGSLPENVNYAIKSNYLLEFLRTEPAVAKKLKSPVPVKGSLASIFEKIEPSVVLVAVENALETQKASTNTPRKETRPSQPSQSGVLTGYGPGVYGDVCQAKSDCGPGYDCVGYRCR